MSLLYTDKFVLIVKSKRNSPLSLISELLQSVCLALVSQPINRLVFFAAIVDVLQLFWRSSSIMSHDAGVIHVLCSRLLQFLIMSLEIKSGHRKTCSLFLASTHALGCLDQCLLYYEINFNIYSGIL